MKISRARHRFEVYTSQKVYVYFLPSVVSRIDAVDEVLERHRQLFPDSHVVFVTYVKEVSYIL